MPFLQSKGYATWYEDDCTCAPDAAPDLVVIQHGFGRSAQSWRHWAPELAGRFRVVRRDLRGHGQSGDNPSLGWSFEGLVDDLDDFIQSFGVPRVHLLGESTGGMLCVGLAARRPDYLATLTLCSAPPTIGIAAQKFFAGADPTWKDALRRLGSRGWGEWLLSQPGTASFDNDADRARWLDQMGRCSTEALANYSAVISTTDIAPLLSGIDVPTLFLAPTRSAATTPAEQRRLAGQVGVARVVEIDGAGHEIYLDRREECLRAFVKLIEDAGRGRAGD